jgi:superfamily I DNA/RNA helicase
MDDFDPRAQTVSLMTIHASKGLEFQAVFIPGCEQGIIPFEVFGKKGELEIREEERLFYVGVTRTKKYLSLTYAKKRMFKNRPLYFPKSDFLNRLETNLLNFEKRVSKPALSSSQLSLFGD